MNRYRDVTYGKFECTVRSEKAEKHRTRLVIGGNRITNAGDVGTPTAEMLLVKIMLNSVISTPGAKFMSIDISNFYLNTPMLRYECMKLKLANLPEEIIQEYKLHDIATSNGSVHVEVRKGMYGLPQAGLLANLLLEKRLNKNGYFQSTIIPGLWTHTTRPIQFTLVVDDFGVKYVGEEHAEHLMSVLREFYAITHDWKGNKYIGITLDWDYERKKVHLSMSGYIGKALTQFKHLTPTKGQDLPYPSAPTKYGAKIQYAQTPVDAPLLDEEGKKFIQQVCGKFLFYGRAVDGTILVALSAIASQQSKPTTDTMAKAKQLLDYLASQEKAILTYSASEMVLAVHSDAGYLNEPNARSRAGGHFFLSNHAAHPPNNGAILNLAQIIKNVMSSATEAELGALFITTREAVYIQNILTAMGHKQPATPIQMDNLTAEGIINSKIQPKQTKAMDMWFH